MPGLIKVLPFLPDLENITPEELQPWAPRGVSNDVLDNYLANRLLYPQAILTDEKQLEWDQMLLKAAINRAKDKFYNPNSRRLIIPPEFMELAPIQQMVKLFIDICKPQLISYIFLKPSTVLGTILTPHLITKSGIISLIIDQQSFTLKIGELNFLPITKSKVDLQFSSAVATLMDEHHFQVEVAGGPVGIIIDTREVPK